MYVCHALHLLLDAGWVEHRGALSGNIRHHVTMVTLPFRYVINNEGTNQLIN